MKDIRTRIEVALADVVCDPLQFTALRDAAVRIVKCEVRRLRREQAKFREDFTKAMVGVTDEAREKSKD